MKNLLLSFIFILPLACFAAKTYTVTVHVKSLDGLKPLKDVTVEYIDDKNNIIFTTITDENGQAVFTDCKEKSFDIFCISPEKIYTIKMAHCYNDNKENYETTVHLAYEKETELQLIAGKMELKEIDSSFFQGDSCLTDLPAEFPGGRGEMIRFLQENMRVPQVAWEKQISGKVYTKFIINLDGTISNIQVDRGIPNCPECDMEAVRVIAYMPIWTPGKCNDQPAIQQFTLPISFKVQ